MNPNKHQVCNVCDYKVTDLFEHKHISKTNDPCT